MVKRVEPSVPEHEAKPTELAAARQDGAVSGVPPPLQVFDWTGLVKGHFFEGMLTGMVGAVIGLVGFESRVIEQPNWLLIDLPLSALCFFLAFTRIWKTIREEHETCPPWDFVSDTTDENWKVLDRVFEIPYLFSITIMPFAVLSPQLFLATLVVFYLTDNFYNAALARGIAERRSGSSHTPGQTESSYPAAMGTALLQSLWLSKPRAADAPVADDKGMATKMIKYFHARSRYGSAFILLTSISVIAVTWLMLQGSLDAARALTWVTLVGIVFVELVVEPLRNRDMPFEPGPDEA